MRDTGGTCNDDDDAPAGMVSLALQAVKHLAARRLDGERTLQSVLLNRIVDLAVSPGDGASAAILDVLRTARVPCEQACDHYLPEAARAFGEAWHEDRMTFSQVTVGVVRLQEVLHELQVECTADALDSADQTTALVIVPPGEQHTLGALVLTLALRRRGISVRLQLSPAMADLSRLLADRQFDLAFVSLGTTDRIETCLKLVKSLKGLTRGRMPVAVGGAVIGECREALAGSEADLVTNDVELAVAELTQQKIFDRRNGG